MIASRGPATVSRLVDRAAFILAALAAASLLAMVLVIAVGVVSRYLFALPILGSNEIVQLVSVAVVMLALPYCTAKDGHVRVDVFDRMIGRRGRFAGDLLSNGLSIYVLGILALRAAAKAVDAQKYGDATNMLGLPIWPFYALIAGGIACAMAVGALKVIATLAGRETDG